MSINYDLSRSIVISSEINSQLAEGIIAQIMDINALDFERAQRIVGYEPEPIEMFINSGGGSVPDGFAIIGAMEMSSTPIVTYGIGLVASMALAIFLSGDVRIVHRYVRLMHHSISYGMMGHITDHEAMQVEADLLQKMYNNILLERTQITEEEIFDIRLMKKDFFFSAEEAIKLGVADELISIKIDEEKTEPAKIELNAPVLENIIPKLK